MYVNNVIASVMIKHPGAFNQETSACRKVSVHMCEAVSSILVNRPFAAESVVVA